MVQNKEEDETRLEMKEKILHKDCNKCTIAEGRWSQSSKVLSKLSCPMKKSSKSKMS
jgi:hypothetical protein